MRLAEIMELVVRQRQLPRQTKAWRGSAPVVPGSRSQQIDIRTVVLNFRPTKLKLDGRGLSCKKDAGSARHGSWAMLQIQRIQGVVNRIKCPIFTCKILAPGRCSSSTPSRCGTWLPCWDPRTSRPGILLQHTGSLSWRALETPQKRRLFFFERPHYFA